MRPARRWCRWLAVALAVSAAAGCGGSPGRTEGAGAGVGTSATVRLYTSYSQDVVDGLLAAYRRARPGVRVELFRAPTGQLNARLAAEQRSGGIRADVLLLSDPLSMQQYAARGLLRRWSPPDESAVPASARTDTFWGVSVLHVVAVHRPGPGPASWQDLADPRYRGKVAIADPGFAGSALGALGYFALADGYGMDYYRRLKDNGAVQVQSPDEVLTGVAEGRYEAGMALDFSARQAIAKGSPLEVSAPDPGAIQIYAPVAVLDGTRNPAAAESFAGFLLTRPAQQELVRLGRTPIRADVRPPPQTGRSVVPDWPKVFQRQGQLLQDYRGIFGD
jgi:iron(III) transport system substrate-binding protein